MNNLLPMLQMIANVYPRPEYEMWLKILSGVYAEHGEAGIQIISSVWPEEKNGEYQVKCKHLLKKISFGTVVHLARKCGYSGHYTTASNRPIHKIALPAICHDEPGKQYNIVEVVTGSPANRPGKLVYIDNVSDLDGYGTPGTVDAYASIYWHSYDLFEYVTSTGKIEGYYGAVKATMLHFDFDDKHDPKNTLPDLQKFIEHICTVYAVSFTDIDVWFSGNKGFSVYVNDKSINDSAGAVDIPERIKKICSTLAEDIATFDRTPYDRTRIWRVPNTINSKSGLYKIPLLPHEIFTWSFERIQERAKYQRSLHDAINERIEELKNNGK